MDISSFLKSLPDAASSPLALIAYVATLVAGYLLAVRVNRNKNLLRRIDQLPPKDRRPALQAEMDTVIPTSISAEKWIELKTRKLYFSAFVIICGCATLVILIAMLQAAPLKAKLTVSGGGPIFQTPRLNGRTIDACIISPKFPSRSDLQCVNSARELISTAFCRAAGYKTAVSFEVKALDEMQLSYKLIETADSGGAYSQAWVEDNTGGLIFQRIACE